MKQKASTGMYMYSQIPGVWKGWTLAVCAVSRKDADTYIRTHHKGGKFSYSVLDGGHIKADCGATTQAAQEILSANIKKMYEGEWD